MQCRCPRWVCNPPVPLSPSVLRTGGLGSISCSGRIKHRTLIVWYWVTCWPWHAPPSTSVLSNVWAGCSKSSKILGARKVTWSKFLGPTNVRLHRTKFSCHADLAPRICSPLFISLLSLAAVAYKRLKTADMSGWLSCYIEKVVIGEFRTAARWLWQAGLLSAAIGDHGEGGLSADRGLSKTVFNVVAVTPSTSVRRGGYARHGPDTAVWQAVREQLYPYLQKFSLGPAEYTRLQRLVGGSSVRKTKQCGTTPPATNFSPNLCFLFMIS